MYRKNQLKDKILKELPLDDYRKYKKDNKSEKEWYYLYIILLEMKSEKYIKGDINLENPDFDISITSQGMLFRENGGYTSLFYKDLFNKRGIFTIVSTIITIIGIIVGLIAL